MIPGTDQTTNRRPDNMCGLEEVLLGVHVSHGSDFSISRLRQHKFSHIVFVDRKPEELIDPNEFECLELDFNRAMVLPNLYKSDKFIAKALKNDGKVLILEPPAAAVAGRHYQKGIAITLGYLMYNFEFSFLEAYDSLRKLYKPFELDRYLVMQLYEYEPILEVHRAAEVMGHSRSGERLRSVLKRTFTCLQEANESSTAHSAPRSIVLGEHRLDAADGNHLRTTTDESMADE